MKGNNIPNSTYLLPGNEGGWGVQSQPKYGIFLNNVSDFYHSLVKQRKLCSN